MNQQQLIRWVSVGAALGVAALIVAGCSGGSGGTGVAITNQAVNPVVLVSDQAVAGATTDTQLANAWGIAFNPAGLVWVADNRTGLATVYDGSKPPKNVLTVTIPPPAGGAGPTAPTGQVFNATADFRGDQFIFDSEDGTIAGWQQSLGTTAALRVDKSAGGAVYKGLAMGTTAAGNFLYAANFNTGAVDVFDRNYAPVAIPGGFTDPSLPAGFAPFNVQNIGGNLYVTYARQNAVKHDDFPGPGNGFIDIFNPSGTLLRRFASGGLLNSPWGIVQAPGDYGKIAQSILVGNFGDGQITVFNGTGVALFQLKDVTGNVLSLPGLWGLSFGNDTVAGAHNQLFFSSGPNGEVNGRFGRLDALP